MAPTYSIGANGRRVLTLATGESFEVVWSGDEKRLLTGLWPLEIGSACLIGLVMRKRGKRFEFDTEAWQSARVAA